MADLIDSTRAKLAIGQASYTSDENTLLGYLITACSVQIQRYCGREFVSTAFTHLINGPGKSQLFLKEFPIITLTRVSQDPTPVLKVTNTSSSVQFATAASTSTGLSLVRVVSGTTTTSTLAFADADKDLISELATAITAVANGWAGTAVTEYASWPSALIFESQGPFDAKNRQVEFMVHGTMAEGYEVDADRGVLTKHNGVWPEGYRNIRVAYTAGYSTVPQMIQEACAIYVSILYRQTKRDPGLLSEKTADYFFQSNPLFDAPIPTNVIALIKAFKRFRF